MESQVIAVVPSKGRHVDVLDSLGHSVTLEKPHQFIPWLRKQQATGNEITTVCYMGGPGRGLYVSIQAIGIPVQQIPIYRVQQVVGLEPKASGQQRANALLAVWQKKRDVFYPLREQDRIVVIGRQMTRRRLALQKSRKPEMLRMHGALRELEFALPEEFQTLIELLQQGLKDLFKGKKEREDIADELKRLEALVAVHDIDQADLLALRLYLEPHFVLGLKRDEEELEVRITEYLETLSIWDWLHPPKDSVLPVVKGFGPAIGGAVIFETGDIRRFPGRSNYRSYARFGLDSTGNFPAHMKGEVSSQNRKLFQALWWWANDQIVRYKHIWKELYLWKKAREMQAHPEMEPIQKVTKDGRPYTEYKYTLLHLHRRAARWTVSQLLNYIWDLWNAIEREGDPTNWYISSPWPDYFSRAHQEAERLKSYLLTEIQRRRKTEPKPPPEFENEDYGDEEEDFGDEGEGFEEE